MRILLSKLHPQGNAVARQSQTIDNNQLSIGRATDQQIHSLDPAVALKHAIITTANSGKLQIRSLSSAGVLVNDQPVQRAGLEVGDKIEIANLLITIEPAEADDSANGIDGRLAVLTTAVEVSSADLDDRYALNLSRAGLKNRRWAWVWGLGVLTLFLLIPLLASLLLQDKPELVEQLRASPLPSDSAWLSGPLHSSHKFIGDACETCHVKPFVMVRDQECMACHSDMSHHADPAEFAMPELDSVRCAVCHQDHHEPTALINGSEKLCTNCHNGFDQHFPESELKNITSFSVGAKNGHPELRVTMLQPGSDKPLWKSLSDPELKDPSGLKFPHDKHLNPEGVKSPDGEQILECNSCHVTDRAGHSMRPISFEQHCQSCHSLDFDSEQPDRQVPHGDPELVTSTLREFYAARYLTELEASMPGNGTDRQRPGRTERMAAELAANQEAKSITAELFGKRSCAVCHTVENTESGWKVDPVVLTEVWMPRANFTHKPHNTTACTDCHATDNSESASDVLMPKLETCQTCHGDSDSSELLQTGCVGCHGFHNAAMPIMRTVKPTVETMP